MESLIDLHECTECKVTGNGCMGDVWLHVKVIREGLSISPIIFNVRHQAVMS